MLRAITIAAGLSLVTAAGIDGADCKAARNAKGAAAASAASANADYKKASSEYDAALGNWKTAEASLKGTEDALNSAMNDYRAALAALWACRDARRDGGVCPEEKARMEDALARAERYRAEFDKALDKEAETERALMAAEKKMRAKKLAADEANREDIRASFAYIWCKRYA
jgi:hypothetical protein